jgi:hypothetical protein
MPLWESEGSVLCSKETVTGSNSEPLGINSTSLGFNFLRFILILLPYLGLDL